MQATPGSNAEALPKIIDERKTGGQGSARVDMDVKKDF